IRDVAEIVRSVVPGSVVTVAAGGEPDTRDYRVDFSKAEELLPGFAPQWDVKKGVEELYRTYVDEGLTEAELSGDRYLRIGRIRQLRAAGALDDDLRWEAE